jgi:hypothetical protein
MEIVLRINLSVNFGLRSTGIHIGIYVGIEIALGVYLGIEIVLAATYDSHVKMRHIDGACIGVIKTHVAEHLCNVGLLSR